MTADHGTDPGRLEFEGALLARQEGWFRGFFVGIQQRVLGLLLL